MAANITPFLETLEAIDSSYDRRREVDKLRDGKEEFVIAITAKEVEQNYSYVREDGYRDGFGFLGTVSGIASEVKILLPTSLNDRAKTWNAGEEHSFTVRFLDWDSPYKQYKLLATGVNTTESPPVSPSPPDAKAVTPEPITKEKPESDNPSEAEQSGQVPPEREPVTKTPPPPEPKPKANIRKVERPKTQPVKDSTPHKQDDKPSLPNPAAKPEPKGRSAGKQQGKVQPKASQPTVGPAVSQQSAPTHPRSFKPTTVNLSQYAPPTLDRVPIRERVATFGGRTKPMQPLVQSQRFTQAPTNPFELVQGEYKKPLILGLKIFGGLFAAFLLLTCICCGVMT